MKKRILTILLLLLFLTACDNKVEKEEPQKKEEEVKETKQEEQKEEITKEDQILICKNIIDSDYYYMEKNYTLTYDSEGKKLKKVELTDSENLIGEAELEDSIIKELKDDCQEMNSSNGITCKFTLSEDKKTATYQINYELSKLSSTEKEELDDTIGEVSDITLEEFKNNALEYDLECE